MSGSATGFDVELSGAGPSFSVAVGGAVAPNIIVYGSFMTSQASNQEVKIDGTVAGTAMGDSTAGVAGMGPGLAYYFGSSNVFLSTTLLLSRLVITDAEGDASGRTNFGGTWEGQLGKEWWVSSDWALGLSGQVMLGAMKDSSPPAPGAETPTWTVRALSLLFSATYN